MPSVRVDGRDYDVPAGQNLLEACLGLGFRLPFFCWHPTLGSVGACRQCAVLQFKDEADEHAGHGRLVMSCMTAAAEGVRIAVNAPRAAEFRRGVIEGLMLHHPHDCPVCDEGGHCHLQDMTVMAGHAYRRYRFDKRTWRNQYLGPLVNHEMNRCIQCYRCVRFYREYAGGGDLEAMGIRDTVYFGRHSDGVLESEFAGNLAEVCPTGVFTDATLKRQYTRKWDLRWAPSLCGFCGLGCNISPGERYGTVRVVVNRYHAAINGYFLCDRGRYGHGYLAAAGRVLAPRGRAGAIPADSARARLGEWIARAQASAPDRILGIGSPRASLESNFALRKLVGPERFYAGLRAGELAMARRILALGRRHGLASLRAIEACDTALVLGEDLTQTAARLALSLRQTLRQQPLRTICGPLHIPNWLDHAAREAIQDATGPLYLATPAGTKLDALARRALRAAPEAIARFGFAVARALGADIPAGPDDAPGGGESFGPAAQAAAEALAAATRPVIVAGMSCGSAAVIEAAGAVAEALSRRGATPALSFVTPECNTLGLALLEPRPLEEALEMARFAELAIVVENDLARRLPPRDAESLWERFSGEARPLVALDQVEHATTARAVLLLPAAGIFEGSGTLVSGEGRAQRFFAVAGAESAPEGTARESWRWLEQAQGRDPDLDAMIAELIAAFPALAAIRAAAPAAGFRVAGQKIPRETHRFSGRTAMVADRSVSEPKPPEDRDAPLTFTMEGYGAEAPAPLTPFFWAPGWNSPQAALQYEETINGPLRGLADGVRLLEGGGGDGEAASAAPPPAPARTSGLLAVRLYNLYGSEELSQHAPALAELAPGAFIGLHPDDAAAAGLEAGALAEVQLDGHAFAAPLRLMPDLARGLCGLPAGPVAFDGFALPMPCTVAKAEAC